MIAWSSRNALKGKAVFSFLDASRALGIELQFPDPRFSFISGASIDSRTIERGELFVALRGSRDDGHRFLADAFRKGASGALIEKSFFSFKQKELAQAPVLYRNLLLVADPQSALVDLAAHLRRFYHPLTVGITGSVGKTSAKEFLNYLLNKKFKVLSSAGNFNNHLGLPLTLLRLKPDHRICIAELGANHKGEIRCLANLLMPQHAIITRISPAHLSGFGSMEGIYEAKLEILEPLPDGAGVVLPYEDRLLFERVRKRNVKILTVGHSSNADYCIENVAVRNSCVSFELNGRSFAFPGVAGFLAINAAMAIAMAGHIGVSPGEIPERWSDLRLPEGRFQERHLDQDIRVIYDGYNASPASFEAALDAFEMIEATGRKFLVFADMLELGDEAFKYHERLGRRASRFPLDYAAAYGPNAKVSIDAIRRENPLIRAEHFERAEDVAAFLRDQIRAGDILLLKASRGMKIDEVLEFLDQKKLTAPPQG